MADTKTERSPSHGLVPVSYLGKQQSQQSAPSSSAAPSSTYSAHPISQRVRSILIQQGDHDPRATKQALDTLASMYPLSEQTSSSSASQPSPSGGPTKARSRNEKEDWTLVDTLSARSNLAQDTRRNLVSTTNHILSILQQVDSSLMLLANDVQTMHTSCDYLHAKLTKAGESSRDLIEHAEGLSKQRVNTMVQLEVSKLFLQRFTLHEEERKVIYSREMRVGKELFLVMDKLDKIRSECQVLLQGSSDVTAGGSTGAKSSTTSTASTRAGMEIMSTSSEDLEQAYQKLYKWCCFEFRQPVKEGLEVSPNLREAVLRLKKARQDLLRSSLSTLVSTRSSILANSFMTALTMGAGPPTYLPGPIELHAHDPIRYVGDMLAWIHQTVASEREFLTSLFGEMEGEGGRRIGQRRRGLEGSVDLTNSSSLRDPLAAHLGPGEALVREVLNQNMDGCCRPLKIRIQQTVRSQEGSVTIYRLAQLIQFYRTTMERTVGTRASLSKTLGELAEQSLFAFLESLQRQAQSLDKYNQVPTEGDLSPPPPVQGAASILKELLIEYDRSRIDADDLSVSKPLTLKGEDAPSSAPSIDAGKEQGTLNPAVPLSLSNFDFVLTNLLDPMLETCQRTSHQVMNRRRQARGGKVDTMGAKWDSLILMANSLEYLILILTPFASTFTGARTRSLETSLEQVLQELTQLLSKDLLDRSGLAQLHERMTANQSLASPTHPGEGGSDAGLEGVSTIEIKKALEQFDRLITNSGHSTGSNSGDAGEDLMSPSSLRLLKAPLQREKVNREALQSLIQVYKSVVDGIIQRQPEGETKQESDDGQIGSISIKTSPEEVAILLGL